MADDLNSTNLLDPEQRFCLEGCRDYAQYHKMRSGFESGPCEFCNLDRTINKVLYENPHWIVWENPFPRNTLGVQLVIPYKFHARYLEDLPVEAWIDLHDVIQWIEGIEGRYAAVVDDEKGGNFHVRFGDMRYNAGTVSHLHWNYWVPNGTGEVRIPVFKSLKDRAENELRATEFAKRYDAGEQP